MQINPLRGNLCTSTDIVFWEGKPPWTWDLFFSTQHSLLTVVVFLAIHDTLLIARGHRTFLLFAMVSNAVDTMWFLRRAPNANVARNSDKRAGVTVTLQKIAKCCLHVWRQSTTQQQTCNNTTQPATDTPTTQQQQENNNHKNHKKKPQQTTTHNQQQQRRPIIQSGEAPWTSWPNPISVVPPCVVRTPHLHGAPTTEETSFVKP